MSSATETSNATTGSKMVDLRLEATVVPVSDVDRAKQFYLSMDWREDADFTIRDDFRIVQLTPPNSLGSIIFGTGITHAAPGSYTGLLAVSDVEVARAAIAGRGVEVTEVYHGRSGWDRFGETPKLPGRDPENPSYNSVATFNDPDGNTWILQEITKRLPGR